MSRLVAAETLKLVTTRLLLWLGLLLLGLEVLVISLHVSQDSLDSLAEARNQRDVVSIAAVSALIALIVGIVVSAGEYTHGTVAPTFLVAPVRERVMAAKLLVGAFAGAFLAAAACAFAWVLAALLLSLRSVSLHLAGGGAARAARDGLGSWDRRRPWRRLRLDLAAPDRRDRVCVHLAARRRAAARDRRGRGFAPGHALASVVEGGTQGSDLLSFGAGLGLSLAYALGFALLGALVVKGSDVT